MPRWYKRDPHLLRYVADEHRLSERGLSTLSKLLDYVGPEGTVAGEVVTNGGAPVVAELLALETRIPLPAQRRAVSELHLKGFLLPNEGTLKATELLVGLIPPPDTSAERQQRFRDRLSAKVGLFDNVTGDAENNVTHNGRITPYRDKRVDSVPIGTDRAAQNGLPDPPAWVAEVVSAVNALRPRDLSTLVPSERHLLARFHALRWANCTRSETGNKSASRKISQGIAALTDRFQRDHVTLSVEQYLRAGQKVWVRGGKTPWFRVFDVLAELVTDPR